MKKLQELPESQRKIVFWIILILVGISLFSLWLVRARQKLESLRGERLFKGVSPPPFYEKEGLQEEDLKENFEELKKLKEVIEKMEEE